MYGLAKLIIAARVAALIKSKGDRMVAAAGEMPRPGEDIISDVREADLAYSHMFDLLFDRYRELGGYVIDSYISFPLSPTWPGGREVLGVADTLALFGQNLARELPVGAIQLHRNLPVPYEKRIEHRLCFDHIFEGVIREALTKFPMPVGETFYLSQASDQFIARVGFTPLDAERFLLTLKGMEDWLPELKKYLHVIANYDSDYRDLGLAGNNLSGLQAEWKKQALEKYRAAGGYVHDAYIPLPLQAVLLDDSVIPTKNISRELLEQLRREAGLIGLREDFVDVLPDREGGRLYITCSREAIEDVGPLVCSLINESQISVTVSDRPHLWHVPGGTSPSAAQSLLRIIRQATAGLPAHVLEARDTELDVDDHESELSELEIIAEGF